MKKLWILVLLLITGCFPDRRPLEPIDIETRRPQIAYMIPEDGDSATAEIRVEIWFDELMDISSIHRTYLMSLAMREEPWTTISSVSALDQSRTNPDLLFLGQRERGAFYSQDGGDSWIFVRGLAEYIVKIIRIDPENAATIFAASDSTLLKSIDGGTNWYSVMNGLPVNIAIVSFEFDPSNSGTVWLGTDLGIYRSDDGGESWMPTGMLADWRFDKPIVKITVDPNNASTIYAATLGRYIYKSTDGGSSWTMKRGVNDRLPGSRIYDVYVDPESSAVLLAATDNRGVYRSADGGENWLAYNDGLNDLTPREIKGFGNSIYVRTGDEIYYTNRNDHIWQPISLPSAQLALVELIVGDQSLLLAVADNIYSSQNHALSWQSLNRIDASSIMVQGKFEQVDWQGEQIFVASAGDTVRIEPYRYDEVLAAYDVGLRDDPPADPDPKATKIIFIPEEALFSSWMYRVYIQGAFDGAVWRGPGIGARDIHGMSLEIDYISHFNVH